MKIYNAVVVRFADIDTDEGCFRVFNNGSMDRWMDDEETGQGSYRWFDDGKYDEKDLEAIRQTGLKLLR